MKTYTLKFVFDMGAFVRGWGIKTLKTELFTKGFDYTINEDKGFLSSTVYLEVQNLTYEQYNSLTNDIKRWVKANESKS